MPGSRSVKFGLLGAALCALGAAASCSQDGVTTSCPDLPLYQAFALGDASRPDAMSGDSEASQEALTAAVKAGCATAPSGDSGAVAGGSGVVGGAGTGGSGGSAGKGGASSGGSAGAAGHG